MAICVAGVARYPWIPGQPDRLHHDVVRVWLTVHTQPGANTTHTGKTRYCRHTGDLHDAVSLPSQGSRADKDGSVWRPTPPLNFASVGDLWTSNFSKPATNAMYAIIDSTCGGGSVQSHLGGLTHLHTECVIQCPQKPQLIWNDKGSGADKDGAYGWMLRASLHPPCTGSIFTLGVSSVGVKSANNFGTHRGVAGYNAPDQKAPWNKCLKPECVKTSAWVGTDVIRSFSLQNSPQYS